MMEQLDITVCPFKDREFRLTVTGRRIKPQHSVGDFGGFEIYEVAWRSTGREISKSTYRRLRDCLASVAA